MFAWAKTIYPTKASNGGTQLADGLRQQIRLEIPEDSATQPVVTINQLRAQIKELEDKRSLELNLLHQFSAQVSTLTTEKALLEQRLRQERSDSAQKLSDFEKALGNMEEEVLHLRGSNNKIERQQGQGQGQEQLQDQEQLELVKKLKEVNTDLMNRLQIAAEEKKEKDSHHRLQLEQMEKIRTRLELHCLNYIAENNSLKRNMRSSENTHTTVDTNSRVLPETQTGKRKRVTEDVVDRKKQRLLLSSELS